MMGYIDQDRPDYNVRDRVLEVYESFEEFDYEKKNDEEELKKEALSKLSTREKEVLGLL